MRLIQTIDDLRRERERARRDGRSIGLVPTMGYLHEGHLSLVRRSRSLADETWVSIFVNPTQFGPQEDLDRYPRDLDRDCSLLRDEQADVVFAPSVDEMYPNQPRVEVAFSGLERALCGASRPVHFGGVGLIVTKLFNLFEPHFAVFGQKDAQQAILIQRLVRDFNFPITIEVAPTVREADGLAMSSRNVNLTAEERRAAPVIHRALIAGKEALQGGANRPEIIVDIMRRMIESEKLLRLDYAECVSVDDLQTPQMITGTMLLAAAAYTSATRLIDNEIVSCR